MYRSHSRQRNRVPDHDHEFLAEHESDVNVQFDGEYVYVTVQCAYAPTISSVTDHERDEIYTETGPQCDTEEKTYIKVSHPYGKESGVVVTYDENMDLWDAIMDDLEPAIEEAASTYLLNPRNPDEATVTTDAFEVEDYSVDLEIEKQEVVR